MYHIQTVRELIKTHKEYYIYFCLAFNDYEKALDTVYTSIVVKSLKSINMDKHYINSINKIYMKATTTTNFG